MITREEKQILLKSLVKVKGKLKKKKVLFSFKTFTVGINTAFLALYNDSIQRE